MPEEDNIDADVDEVIVVSSEEENVLKDWASRSECICVFNSSILSRKKIPTKRIL